MLGGWGVSLAFVDGERDKWSNQNITGSAFTTENAGIAATGRRHARS
jgi:hypothetical protein